MSGLDIRPIYGPSTTPDTTFRVCLDLPALAITLRGMLSLVKTLKLSVEKYLPAVNIGLSLKGTVTTRATIPPILMVRVLWAETYPGAKADKTNYFYRSAIKEMYYILNRGSEWSKDPLAAYGSP